MTRLGEADWWRSAVVYQIYPRSFSDHDRDGTGDILGIIDRLPYLAQLGIDALWISPWYPSPLADGHHLKKRSAGGLTRRPRCRRRCSLIPVRAAGIGARRLLRHLIPTLIGLRWPAALRPRETYPGARRRTPHRPTDS